MCEIKKISISFYIILNMGHTLYLRTGVRYILQNVARPSFQSVLHQVMKFVLMGMSYWDTMGHAPKNVIRAWLKISAPSHAKSLSFGIEWHRMVHSRGLNICTQRFMRVCIQKQDAGV